MRMLQPPNHQATCVDDDQRQDLMQQWKEKALQTFVSSFEKNKSKVFCKNVSNAEVLKRQRELLDIYRRAGDLSTKLSAQNVQMKIYFYDELINFTGNKFAIGSEEMEPHRSMHLEEDDHRCDDRQIDLCVSPAILAWGDEHGENYDEYKVWAKAVVWIDVDNLDGKLRKEQMMAAKAKQMAEQHDSKNSLPSPSQIILIPDDEEELLIKKSSSVVNKKDHIPIEDQAGAYSIRKFEIASSTAAPESKPRSTSVPASPNLTSSRNGASFTKSAAAEPRPQRANNGPMSSQVNNVAESVPATSAGKAVPAEGSEGKRKRKRSGSPSNEVTLSGTRSKKQKGGDDVGKAKR